MASIIPLLEVELVKASAALSVSGSREDDALVYVIGQRLSALRDICEIGEYK